MTHRSDRVYLEPHVERCDPGASACAHRLGCARYMAALPASGALMENFAFSNGLGFDGSCAMYWPLGEARRPVAQPAQPKVHPPLGSAL